MPLLVFSVCTISRSESLSELEILHNGTVIDRQPNTTTIMLDVMEAQLTDAGSYTCHLAFADSASVDVDMGFLTVVGMIKMTVLTVEQVHIVHPH